MTATCDPAYYAALRARGWMESEREVAVQQSLIPRSDSILEYTCFDEFLKVLASNAMAIFSENEIPFYQDFPQPNLLPNIDPTSMDKALQNLVAYALGPYSSSKSNFPYLRNFSNNRSTASPTNTFLGGRTGLSYRLKAVEIGADTLHPAEGTMPFPGYSYQCSAMRDVWIAARCMNANQVMAIDDFFPMSKYPDASGSTPTTAVTFGGTAWDPRQDDFGGALLGGNCPTADPRWQNNYYRIGTNDLGYAGRYQNQIVAAQTNFYGPLTAGCSGAACCPTPPIPTGVQVTRGVGSNLKNYMEFICVNAGCAFQRGGNGSATTPQATGSCTLNPPQ